MPLMVMIQIKTILRSCTNTSPPNLPPPKCCQTISLVLRLMRRYCYDLGDNKEHNGVEQFLLKSIYVLSGLLM